MANCSAPMCPESVSDYFKDSDPNSRYPQSAYQAALDTYCSIAYCIFWPKPFVTHCTDFLFFKRVTFTLFAFRYLPSLASFDSHCRILSRRYRRRFHVANLRSSHVFHLWPNQHRCPGMDCGRVHSRAQRCSVPLHQMQVIALKSRAKRLRVLSNTNPVEI